MEKIKINKTKVFEISKRIILCLLGSLILAFGTAAFLVPANVVAGGISGIGIIISHFAKVDVVDLVSLICNIIAFILAIIFLGKKFTLHTLIATFAYPLFLFLFNRTSIISFIIKEFDYTNPKIFTETRLVMAGVFGGLGVGTGVALTFKGEGSTGGLDVIAFILNKALGIKQSVSSFILDATIILLGLTVSKGAIFPTLIGALSAGLAAIIIELMYVQGNPYYVAEIITDKYEEINKFAIEELDRTSTIFEGIGGYTHQNKKMVRLVFNKKQLAIFKDKIRSLDPKAFVTITSTRRVLGEGFSMILDKKSVENILQKIKDRKNKKSKDKNDNKNE